MNAHPTLDAPLARFRTTDPFGAYYRRHGYVILTDLAPVAALDDARDSIVALFSHQLEGHYGNDPAVLTRHYGANIDAWRQCARRMGDLLPVHRLLGSDALDAALAQAGLARPMLSTPPEVRTDMPGDVRYMQPWHQDWRYGQGSVNSITIWIPLHDVDEENGTIEIIPGTHRRGALPADELPDPRRFALRDAEALRRPRMPVVLRKGECVLFSQLLVHRSGVNRSGAPRITTQLRFADHAEPAYARNRLPKPSGSEILWDQPPTAADAERVFGGDT